MELVEHRERVGQQERLQHIAQALHDQLAAVGLVGDGAQPIAVRGAVKGDRLLILVEHLAETALDEGAVLHHLEQAIPELPRHWLESLLPEMHHGVIPVKLYLRHRGQPKPYRSHPFELGVAACDLIDPALLELPLLEDALPDATSSIDEPLLSLEQLSLESLSASDVALSPETSPEADSEVDSEADFETTALPVPITRPKPFERALARLPLVGESPNDSANTGWFDSGWWWLAVGGVATVAFVGTTTFMLTRPCVMGTCSPLQAVAELNQLPTPLSAVPLATYPAAPPAFVSVKPNLQGVQGRIRQVPQWSAQYAEAAAVTDGLERSIAAETTAEKAAEQSRSTPQSVTQWQTAQASWQEAIAQLTDIPAQNPLAPFVQQRLTVYRAHLTVVERQIAAEQDARRRIVQAKKAATMAETRQNSARQLRDWQTATATWQTVVNLLRESPPGTSSESQTSELLRSYAAKLETTRDLTNKELASQKAYTQALQLQKRSQAAEKQNQMTQAASLLQSALTYAQQVPSQTQYYDAAQTLTASLAARLEQTQAIAKSRSELTRVCAAAGKICDYTIKPTGIQVRFTPTYEKQINQLKATGVQTGDGQTLEQINQHIASLEAALQVVANTVQVPVQVYSSSNQLVGSFAPGG
jgi:hypothetical protein